MEACRKNVVSRSFEAFFEPWKIKLLWSVAPMSKSDPKFEIEFFDQIEIKFIKMTKRRKSCTTTLASKVRKKFPAALKKYRPFGGDLYTRGWRERKLKIERKFELVWM